MSEEIKSSKTVFAVAAAGGGLALVLLAPFYMPHLGPLFDQMLIPALEGIGHAISLTFENLAQLWQQTNEHMAVVGATIGFAGGLVKGYQMGARHGNFFPATSLSAGSAIIGWGLPYLVVPAYSYIFARDYLKRKTEKAEAMSVNQDSVSDLSESKASAPTPL